MCVGLYYFVFRCSDVKCFSYIMMKTKFLQNKQCIYFVVPSNPNLRTHIYKSRALPSSVYKSYPKLGQYTSDEDDNKQPSKSTIPSKDKPPSHNKNNS